MLRFIRSSGVEQIVSVDEVTFTSIYGGVWLLQN